MCLIDFGNELYLLDDGFYVVLFGVIWLVVVFGFVGIDISGELFEIVLNILDFW